MLRSPDLTYVYEVSTAYVVINCESGYEEPVLEGLREIDAVKEVMGTYGNYDIVAKVESPTLEELRETIICKVRRIKNIRCTTTLMCAKYLVWA
ncbi:MAG: Lrp/AsnC family transcriptional regulator [Thaumarchaeota archaeon]|nr:MAG: Lrp/AsnC family transcriptional regulator [Nitrososphaerota archaeon]